MRVLQVRFTAQRLLWSFHLSFLSPARPLQCHVSLHEHLSDVVSLVEVILNDEEAHHR